MAELIFDRVVSDALLTELREGGRFHDLLLRRKSRPDVADIELRREQRGKRSWVSLYVGLTSVLDLDELGGRFRLRAHATHKKAGTFLADWGVWQEADSLASQWTEVAAYLDRLLADEGVSSRWWRREGIVQASLTSNQSSAYGAVQRDAVVSFPSTSIELSVTSPIRERIWKSMELAGRTDPWWPGVRDRGRRPILGTEADLVAVDAKGRLLVIEAKPAEELKGITWAPAQVRLYAEVFGALVEDNPATSDLLNTMVSQRASLSLLDPTWEFGPTWDLRVVPVVAIGGWPLSPVALDRVSAIVSALDAWPPSSDRLDPLEIWFLDQKGQPDVIWRPSLEPPPERQEAVFVPTPALDGSSFVAVARRNATDWKMSTRSLPEVARQAGTYGGGAPLPFCLPTGSEHLNLLPDAREVALSRFKAADIRWHGGIDDGPSNHLLDSQVQCVNALAPFVDRPEALAEIFRSVLPISKVLPFGAPTHSPYDATDTSFSNGKVFLTISTSGLSSSLYVAHTAPLLMRL